MDGQRIAQVRVDPIVETEEKRRADGGTGRGVCGERGL